jgi:hypothetical protein
LLAVAFLAALGGCRYRAQAETPGKQSVEPDNIIKVCPKWLSPDNPTGSGECMFDASKVELHVLIGDKILGEVYAPMSIICGREADPDIVARKVAASTLFQRQKNLTFRDCALGDRGAAALAHSDNLKAVESLVFDAGGRRLPLGDTGAQALARATAFGRLEQLIIHGSHITDRGAGALADSTQLADLESISLFNLNLTDQAARRFVNRKGLPQLQDVYLQSVKPLSTDRAVLTDLVNQARAKGFVLRLAESDSGIK